LFKAWNANIRNEEKTLKNIQFGARTLPFALLLVGLLAFGPIIPWLGLYWDDWPSLWFLNNWGPSIFPKVFTIDRPLLGALFIFTTSIVGESMIAWQIFGIITRVINAIVLVWFLNILWPGRRFEQFSIAFLYMIYPGFRQQYIPITYSQYFIVHTVFYLSLGTMLLAFKKRRWFWPLILFSIFSSATIMFTVEYFVGLELLRPLLLWWTMEDKIKGWMNRLFHAILRWLPYLALLGIFVVWRGTNETPRGEITIINDFLATPINAVMNLIRDIAEDIFQSTVIAWWDALNLSQLSGTKWFIIAIYAAVLILTSFITILYLAKLNTKEQNDKSDKLSDRQWALEAILVGLYALLAGGWPIWATNMHIDLYFPWDRFTLLMMSGASILFMGLVVLLVRKQIWKAVIVGTAVGLAAGAHFLIAVNYRQDWSIQKDYFWQMVWRMPEIEEGTTLIIPSLPFEYVTDNSLTAPLNWTYAPGNTSFDMPYLMLDLDARVGVVLDDVEEDLSIYMPYRGTSFTGSTSQAIVGFYDPPRCFKVLDPTLDVLWPNKPSLLTIEAIQLSKPDLIQSDPKQPAEPPTHLFGPEPEPNWCYYFEKAELARQNGEWEEITRLGDQALKLGKTFSKETAPELTPFIEGYARSDQWDKALELSLEIKHHTPKIDRLLCQIWSDISKTTEPTEEAVEAYEKIQKKFQCENP
jgi:hypothetical protein